MMVKFLHAVVADVAMRAPEGPENVASIAEFKLEEHWRVGLTDLQVEDS